MDRLADESSQPRKRPRCASSEPSDMPPAEGQRQSVKRRQQHNHHTKVEDEYPLRIAALHRVVCNKLVQKESDHSHHEDSALYTSPPKLFAGDNRASALRAADHTKIRDEEQFLEDADVVIYHTYACHNYQATLQDQFESFMPPELDRRVFRENRAYFFSLHHDTKQAKPENMSIRIRSNEVHLAISSAVSLDSDLVEPWDQEKNLQYPFPFFFHHRQSLKAAIGDSLDPRSEYLVNSVLSEVEHLCETEYQEADVLFAAGLVNRRHFDKLFNNGEMIVTYQQGQPVAYRLKDVKSRAPFMIDYEMYHALHETPEEDNVYGAPEDVISADSTDEPDERLLLSLPPQIRGFGFLDKKWRILDVAYIEKIKFNKEAFRRLHLESDKKDLIQALVTVHTSLSKTADIIEGKGNGLIVLLHGGPGTGKTLTAEAVAELAEKPLYRVTCGDMGTDAQRVEEYLEEVLRIGTVWQCVVLLDEADVFLEERTHQDVKRNALVSAFLRALEYYEGILILTTNRIGTFDEAFKSRIQLPVHYPDLDETGRKIIWRSALNDIPPLPRDFDRQNLLDHIDKLATHRLNGRQIRSTVNTAMKYAHFKEEQLSYRHFEVVIRTVMEFDRYTVETRGQTDSEWAEAEGLRKRPGL
ncbi:hypothetical protein H2204_006539 [Knufia peltigerae]|uniref:AAA+ ATPase domain-containing protein n=1 Tax=Knufia peltigerae TaxID=1002370 RepID=A0AA38Y3R4_9EURO|nr:hypothetical protein H2204_006539 [Knufia peltigerae]